MALVAAQYIVKILGPRIPLITKNAVYQTLGLSQESAKWDLRMALIITTLRDIMESSPSPVSRIQAMTLKEPPIMGPIWISKAAFPRPEDDIRQLLLRVVEEMKVSGSETFTVPSLEAVTGEWTGYRNGAGWRAGLPAGLSEKDKYDEMMKEVKSDVTILYFHGGAYYLMDPATHRSTLQKLAQLTKGRGFNVRYRLAPQNPFPAALLDCLVAYLTLLYPPPGSFHEPVKPEHIIFAGDSAGGNMALVMLLFCLHLHHTGKKTVRFHGKDVEVPLPAGTAPSSAWGDMTHALPSWNDNAHYDYLPGRRLEAIKHDGVPRGPPPCEIWPSKPPRADMYCDGAAMCHPLISPLAARSEGWKDSPPLFFCYGEEMLLDEGKVMAQRAANAGVKVWVELFEAMPHVFAAMFLGYPVSERCFKGWAEWISQCVEGAAPETGGLFISAPKMTETPIEVEKLYDMTDEEVYEAMDKTRDTRVKIWQEGIDLDGSGENAGL